MAASLEPGRILFGFALTKCRFVKGMGVEPSYSAFSILYPSASITFKVSSAVPRS
jgi:hypothetical protein